MIRPIDPPIVNLLFSWVNPAGLKNTALQSSARPLKQLPMEVDLAPTVPICVPLLARMLEEIEMTNKRLNRTNKVLRVIFSSLI